MYSQILVVSFLAFLVPAFPYQPEPGHSHQHVGKSSRSITSDDASSDLPLCRQPKRDEAATDRSSIFHHVPFLIAVTDQSESTEPGSNNPLTSALEMTRPSTRGEFTEHSYLGDHIKLKDMSGNERKAGDSPFVLPNTLNITYGQINGLAGDYYATFDPISDGVDLNDQMKRFGVSWASLAIDTERQPSEAQELLALLQQEVDSVNSVMAAGKDPSSAWGEVVEDQTLQFQLETLFRSSDYPSYLRLSMINWDHFGNDAHTAYNAGHSSALIKAAAAVSEDDLRLAYAMNAFGDHFLEDMFSSGHLRVPRRELHWSPMGMHMADLCAKNMHDEENAIGVSVQNKRGDSWYMYGDRRYLDKENKQSLAFALEAVQLSADEVYEAFTTKKVKTPDQFGVWNIAPTLESANSETQTLAPLFKVSSSTGELVRRTNVTKRRDTSAYTNDYSFAGTLEECETSGMWTYPISLGDN